MQHRPVVVRDCHLVVDVALAEGIHHAAQLLQDTRLRQHVHLAHPDPEEHLAEALRPRGRERVAVIAGVEQSFHVRHLLHRRAVLPHQLVELILAVAALSALHRERHPWELPLQHRLQVAHGHRLLLRVGQSTADSDQLRRPLVYQRPLLCLDAGLALRLDASFLRCLVVELRLDAVQLVAEHHLVVRHHVVVRDSRVALGVAHHAVVTLPEQDDLCHTLLLDVVGRVGTLNGFPSTIHAALGDIGIGAEAVKALPVGHPHHQLHLYHRLVGHAVTHSLAQHVVHRRAGHVGHALLDTSGIDEVAAVNILVALRLVPPCLLQHLGQPVTFALLALPFLTFPALPLSPLAPLGALAVVAVQFRLAFLILLLHLLELSRSLRVVRVAVRVHLYYEPPVLLLQLLVGHTMCKIFHIGFKFQVYAAAL